MKTQRLNHFLKNISRQQFIALILLAIGVVFIFIFSIANLSFRAGKIQVTVQFAPYNATVSLNGKTIKNAQKHYLEPGKYQLSVTAEHFEELTKEVIVSKDDIYLVGNLTPSDQAGQDYAAAHSDEFRNTESLVSIELNREGAEIKKEYPILSKLPYNNSLYSLSYSYPKQQSQDQDQDINEHIGSTKLGQPLIAIKANPENIDIASAKLKDFAADTKDELSNYQISFENLQNDYTKLNDDIDNSAAKQSASDYLATALKKPHNLEIRIATSKEQSNYFIFKLQEYNYDLDLIQNSQLLILANMSGHWQALNQAAPILTRYNAPGIPAEILQAANQL